MKPEIPGTIIESWGSQMNKMNIWEKNLIGFWPKLLPQSFFLLNSGSDDQEVHKVQASVFSLVHTVYEASGI